jgi:phosphate-selective porin OprO/OprP
LATLLSTRPITSVAQSPGFHPPIDASPGLAQAPDFVGDGPPFELAPTDPVQPAVADQIRALQEQLDTLRAQIGNETDAAYPYPVATTNEMAPLLPAAEAYHAATADEPTPAPAIRYPTLTMNGVFQADAGFFSQDAVNRATVGNAVDGADFRRARLSAKGAVTDSVNYFFQMDFAFFGRPTFTDVWLEQTGLPFLGNFRIGQWKQPFSLEVVSSFRYTTFMERSLLFQPFTPFRHLGAGFYDHAESGNMTWAVSGFRSGQDQFGGSATNAAGWGTCERITWLPWYDEASNGRGYCHLGLAHFFATPPDHGINFRTIPEMFIGQQNGIPNGNQQPVPGNMSGTPFFLQTGNLLVNSYNVLGAENLLVLGRFSWQTEVMVNFVNRANSGTDVFPGFYSQVGYFLTGEHRPYDRKAGAIDRVIPFEDFFRVCTSDGPAMGWGAWEVAGRVSYLDFHDVDNVVAPGTGGDLFDTTLGVNWYWNPYTKLVANWVHSFLDNPQTGRSDADSYAVRAQIDF